MEGRTPNFARVLAVRSAAPDRGADYRAPSDVDDGPLRGPEIDAALDLGYAMAAANGDASYDELVSFRALVKHLKGDVPVSSVLDEVSAKLDAADSTEAFVRAAAARLTRRAAREMAYKIACTIAVFDLETNEEERDLDDLLVEVLGVEGRVADLENEVHEALTE